MTRKIKKSFNYDKLKLVMHEMAFDCETYLLDEGFVIEFSTKITDDVAILSTNYDSFAVCFFFYKDGTFKVVLRATRFTFDVLNGVLSRIHAWCKYSLD